MITLTASIAYANQNDIDANLVGMRCSSGPVFSIGN